MIELSEEGVVFFYYALLVAAIICANPWLLGVSIALCLMSRYSFAGWIPFAVLLLILQAKISYLVKTAIAAGLVILILMIPFGVHPFLQHLHLHQQYIAHAQRVWHDNPEFYTEDLGMAKFFGPHHVLLLHYILEAGSFGVPLLFLWFVRKKNIPVPNLLLAGLQLTLTFFYNFLDVTYLYLYYTPVFVSVAIASWSISRNQSGN